MSRKSKTRIGGILVKRELSLICLSSVADWPGAVAAIFDALGKRAINCPFIVQSTQGPTRLGRTVTLCVAEAQLAEALEALEAVGEAVGAPQVVCDERVGMVSIFGPHFGERAGISGVMFGGLEGAGIHIQAISTSISSLSCIVPAEDVDRAVEALQAAFEMP